MHDQELMSRNACDVAQNELDPCSNGYFLERVSELIIISNLHCQSIHYFALRNLRFRLESKSLTLWVADHTESCIRAKHFRLSLQQIFNYSSKRRQAVKVISDTDMYLNS